MPELPLPLPLPLASRFTADELVELGREVLRIEADAVLSLVNRLGPAFAQAVRLILECRDRKSVV